MKPTVIVLVLAAVAAGVYLALPKEDDESATRGSDPLVADSPQDGPAPVPDAPAVSEPGGGQSTTSPDDPPAPMTVDEYIDRHMGKNRDAIGKTKKLSPLQQLAAVEVSLAEEDQSALDILLHIAEKAGVRVEAAEDMQADLKGAPVNMVVEKLSGKAAFELVLALASPHLTFSEKGDRILIHRK